MGQTRVVFGAGNHRQFVVKSNLKQIGFEFYLLKVATVSRSNSNSGLIQDCWLSYKEACFPILSLALRTKRCLDTGDLGVLGISENINRLTKYVGC